MRKLIVGVLSLALLLAACGSQPGSVEGRQIAALETRIAALEAKVAALPTPAAETHTGEAAGTAFQVVVAQYLIETAGFHALDESLNETKTVDPAYISTVNRVRKVVERAPWPEELHEQAGAFAVLLTDLAAALEADDGEAAAALAAEAHTAQHDFSHALDTWLGTAEGEHGHGD